MVAPVVLRAKSDITAARVLFARASAACSQTAELQHRALLFLRKQEKFTALATLHLKDSPGSDGGDASWDPDSRRGGAGVRERGEMKPSRRRPPRHTRAICRVGLKG